MYRIPISKTFKKVLIAKQQGISVRRYNKEIKDPQNIMKDVMVIENEAHCS